MTIQPSIAKKARGRRKALSKGASRDSFTIFRLGRPHIEKTLRYWKRGASPELLLKIKPIEDNLKQLQNLPQTGLVLTASNLGICIAQQFDLLNLEIGQAGATGPPLKVVTIAGHNLSAWDLLRDEVRRVPGLSKEAYYDAAAKKYQVETGNPFPLAYDYVIRRLPKMVAEWQPPRAGRPRRRLSLKQKLQQANNDPDIKG